MNVDDVIVYHWPGGLQSRAIRGQQAIFDRSWQNDTKADPSVCPFCNSDVEDLRLVIMTDAVHDWQLRDNKYPKYPLDNLILPLSCWPPEKQRILGGMEGILAALDLAAGQIEKHNDVPIVVNVHIGGLAGQRIPHVHWHVAQYMVPTPAVNHSSLDFFKSLYAKRSDLIVFPLDDIVVGVGGIRAGQCFIIPYEQRELKDMKGTLAFVLYKLITMYNWQFRSTQGLSPDFSISLYFQEGGFEYGVYYPVLNQWGSAEFMALYEHERWSIMLPWPHEETVQHLKKYQDV